METPKRIYISELCRFECGSEQCSTFKENSDVEYIRSDISEAERNAFAIFCFDAGRWGGERDANKLYELFNSRKK